MDKKEKLLILWLTAAIVLAITMSTLFNASFPIFTILWLSAALIAVLKTKNAEIVGFSYISFKDFLIITSLNLGITLLIIGLFEPWSHTYQTLLRLATDNNHPDVTFSWLTKFSGVSSWLGMFIFSGLVTMFGEEIFFRGLVFQFFRKRVHPNTAIIIQALLFIVPNLLAAFFMNSLQGFIYTFAYAGAGIGVVGGWAAKKTNSIWPGLVSANIVNLLAVLLLY